MRRCRTSSSQGWSGRGWPRPTRTGPETEADRPRLRRLATQDLTPPEIAAIRDLLVAAFGSDEDERFGQDDWDHAVGGVHFVLDIDGELVAHASVVERELHVDGRPLRTGYVEAVGTAVDRQGAGLGSLVMADVTSYIGDHFELGALATGRHRFYERLGWLTWTGPTFVRTPDGPRPTPEEDGDILVLRTPSTPPLDPTASISCEWREGDVW
jgi:aminoglycoside 2'-N-acetyltransferase I